MKKNIGSADRAIRVIAAILIAVLYATHTISGTTGIVALVAGGILLVTAVVNFCPLYALLGMSTGKKNG